MSSFKHIQRDEWILKLIPRENVKHEGTLHDSGSFAMHPVSWIKDDFTRIRPRSTNLIKWKNVSLGGDDVVTGIVQPTDVTYDQ